MSSEVETSLIIAFNSERFLDLARKDKSATLQDCTSVNDDVGRASPA